MLLLLAVLLTTSDAAETLVVTLSDATQSSNYHTDKKLASWAIDGDRSTKAATAVGAGAWLRVHFLTDIEVGKVVIEEGWQTSLAGGTGKACVYQMFIYSGDKKLPCGDKFTHGENLKGFLFYYGYDNTTINCGGKRGGSVVLEQTVCNQYISVAEIKVYVPESGPIGPCYLKNTDLYGGDISCSTFTSIVNCKNTCAATSGCIAFTTVQDASQRCCLKNSNYEAVITLDYCTSGYMNCFNEMWTAESGGYSNLAYNRPAYQSSLYQPYGAALAVDGNTDAGSISHTSVETKPWWMVSLAGKSYVAYIRIYNRGDCCGDRLDGATIYLDDLEIGVVAYVSGQQPYTFTLGKYGTTVKVIIPGDNKTLSMAELEVYGRSRSPADETWCIRPDMHFNGAKAIMTFPEIMTTLACMELCLAYSECRALSVSTNWGCILRGGNMGIEETQSDVTSVRKSCLEGGSCWQKGLKLQGTSVVQSLTTVSACITACKAETGCVAIHTNANKDRCTLYSDITGYRSDVANYIVVQMNCTAPETVFKHWMEITNQMETPVYEDDYQVDVIIEYMNSVIDDSKSGIKKNMTFSHTSNTTLCQDNTGTYLGSNYRGFVNRTENGKGCQKWTSQSPHTHTNTPTDKPGVGLGDHNYCRNPDGSAGGVWCYTVKEGTRSEYCSTSVPMCAQDWAKWGDSKAEVKNYRLGYGIESTGCYVTEASTSDTEDKRKLEIKVNYNELVTNLQDTRMLDFARPNTASNCDLYTHAIMPTTIRFYEFQSQYYYLYRVGEYIR